MYCLCLLRVQLYNRSQITKLIPQLAMDNFSISRIPSIFNTLQQTVISLVVTNALEWGILPLVVTNIVANQTKYKPLYEVSVGKMTKSSGNITNRDKYVTDFFY